MGGLSHRCSVSLLNKSPRLWLGLASPQWSPCRPPPLPCCSFSPVGVSLLDAISYRAQLGRVGGSRWGWVLQIKFPCQGSSNKNPVPEFSLPFPPRRVGKRPLNLKCSLHESMKDSLSLSVPHVDPGRSRINKSVNGGLYGTDFYWTYPEAT